MGRNRQVEADHIVEEVSIVEQYEVAFDTALLLIANEDAERTIIDAKNS